MADEIDVTEVTKQLYGILKPLVAGDRKRVINAVLTLLGEDIEPSVSKPSSQNAEGQVDEISGLSSKAKLWMRQNGITQDSIGGIFHSNGDSFDLIIGASPGKNLKEKTLNAYVLKGLTQYLQTGEAKFDDESARDVCKSLGCLNEGNHAKYLKEKGNLYTGSKSSGWTLTGPGLKAGAEIVKGIVNK
ncbi:hypothetical protein [Methylobacterium sp. J-070]|uniref:hypothetical protein n=1 Tax=Methylobacterium sp. J-070 TaxID=2836650 RepID=UPI001FBB0116|nr:hypothetical protein [Methylobacterium sp. J-070]MCJ2051334.1 hypothetical protein [Methylobacterium sp. J-070]